MHENATDESFVKFANTTWLISKSAYSNEFFTTKEYCAGNYTITVDKLKRYVNFLENTYNYQRKN